MDLTVTRTRAQRIAEERDSAVALREDIRRGAEDDQRELNDLETEQIARHTARIDAMTTELDQLADDLERAEGARDVSALLHRSLPPAPPTGPPAEGDAAVYRTFAQYARDWLIDRYPVIERQAAQLGVTRDVVRARLERVPANTLTTDIAGLVPAAHLAQIMNVIDARRPLIESARRVGLDQGKLTYPKISQRPAVAKQTTQKTEAGNQKMTVDLVTVNADTYLGGGDLSWQAINWSTPDALQLWFDLAAEEYARQTEAAAAAILLAETTATSAVAGTTPTFEEWWAAIVAGLGTISTNTGGRGMPNTVWISMDRFFRLAGLVSTGDVKLTAAGNLNLATRSGTIGGLTVVGTYGFAGPATVIGDSGAFLVGETSGAPVELRAVEPAIGGMEVGIIGAMQAKVFDPTRFVKLTHGTL